MNPAYEVIWSYAEDRYIVRKAFPWQLVTPEFVGSFEACNAYLSRLCPR